MAKYIPARVLYGNFNMDYLLGKYNDKFLKDLGESRFCAFLEFFLDTTTSPVVGYDKYFKYSKCDHNKSDRHNVKQHHKNIKDYDSEH